MTRAASIVRRLVSPIATVRATIEALTLPVSAAAMIGRAIARGCRRRPIDPTFALITHAKERYDAIAGAGDLTGTIWRRFAVAFVAATLATAWAIVLSKTVSPVTVATAASVAATLWLASASASMAHWQTRTRQLGSVGEWLRQPREWLPPSTSRLATVVIYVSALVPAAAIAAEATGGDMIAQSILSTILPTIGGAGTAATHAIGALSSVLSLCGCATIAWSFLHAIVGAAASGQLVSERTSAWAPIRVVIGIGMLLPLPSGLSSAHEVLALLAGQGSRLATQIATGYFTESLTGTLPEAALPAAALTVGGQELAHAILAAELCAAMMATDQQNLTGSSAGIAYPPTEGQPGYEAGSDGTGAMSTQWWDYSACGSISLPITSSPSAAAAFSRARIDNVSALIQQIRGSGIAAEMADPNGPWPTATLSSMQPFIAAYDAAQRAAASAFVSAQSADATDRILSQLSTDGWPMAGAYAMAVSTRMAAIDDAVAVSPDVRTPTAGAKQPGFWKTDSDVAIDGAIRRLSEDWKQQSTTTSLHATDLTAAGDNATDVMTRALAPVSQRLTQSLIAAAAPRQDEPLVSIVALGHGMLLAGEAGMVGGGAIATVANSAPSKLFGGDGAWAWAAPWVKFIIDLCLGIGTFLAYYVPIIPTISMYWLLVNWSLLLAESFVAVPVLAFLFCRLEGQELVDSVQKPGCAILFNLYFKPAFGVLGLILAQQISPILINALCMIFPASYAGSQGGHLIGIIGLLFGLGLFGYLIVKSQIEIGQLITLIPDRIPRWLGMSAESTGGSASGTHAAVMSRTGGGGGGGKMSGGKPTGSGGGGSIKPGGKGGGNAPSSSGSTGGAGGDRRGPQRVDPDHWSAASGGAEGLDESQMANAQAAYSSWASEYPERFGGGEAPDFDSYVSYVQERRANERG